MNAAIIQKLAKNEFSPERFVKWAKITHNIKIKCYGRPHYSTPLPFDLDRLFDHGFIVDGACRWGDLNGHEIAIISRTYCSDEEINNPPEGLKCWRLPPEVMGVDDIGTPIATVIVSPSPAAEVFLTHLQNLPAEMLGYAISGKMISEGCQVILDAKNGAVNYPLVKISPPTIQYSEGFFDE